MRVLFVGPPPEARGGAARSARRVVAGLRARGHAVCWCAPDPQAFGGEGRKDTEQWRFAGEPALDAWCDEALAAARAHDPEVLVGWYLTAGGFVAASVGALRGRPVVVSGRGNDLDRDHFEPGKHALLRFALERSAARVVVSREMVAKIGAWYGVSATFIANTVDPSVFFPDPAAAAAARAHLPLDGRPVLGLFGELKEKRGLQRLARWRPALDAWQVLVVGTLRAEVKHALPPGALHVPWVDDDDALRGLYGVCAAVAQPSLRDGMPNAVLEAAACGIPVYGSPVGGIPDAVVDGVTGRICADDAAFAAVLAEGPTPALGLAARAQLRDPAAEIQDWEGVLRGVVR